MDGKSRQQELEAAATSYPQSGNGEKFKPISSLFSILSRPGFPAWGIKMDLPISINVLKRVPHRHAQSPIFQVILVL